MDHTVGIEKQTPPADVVKAEDVFFFDTTNMREVFVASARTEEGTYGS